MKHGINTTHTIKLANTHLVLNTLRQTGPLTVEELVRHTRLSRPTVLNIIDDLLQRRIIDRVGYAEAAIGRQPMLYAIHTASYFAIGIDFEFPPMHLIVTDLSGAIRYEKNWECSVSMDTEHIISLLIEQIQQAMDTLSLTLEHILGIGLGIPGTVNMQKNMSEIISRIPKWNRTPLQTILSEHFPVPIYVRNDAHLMALAAQQYLLPDETDLMYLAYRTGIGMAILQNGTLSEGSFGNSGYIGHTTVQIDGKPCSCGKKGCLETVASKPAIEQLYMHLQRLEAPLAFDEILAAAADEASDAAKLFQTAGFYFGIALANCVKLLDIHTIVIDDLNCSADHIFVKTLAQTVNDYCSSYVTEPVKIIPHNIKKEEYALGAALFVLEQFFQNPEK